MMYQSNDYSYQLGEGYQAVGLPYRGYGFDLLVIMPDEGSFEAFEESLTGERLQAITDNLGWGDVILEMRRFKLDYGFSAKEGLQALGLTDAFERDLADFRPVAEKLFGLPVEELWIKDAVQKAFVEVNERGSEAAAATAFFGGATSVGEPPPPVPITIDRPFIFLLRHSYTGAVLFMGRVLNPDSGIPGVPASQVPATPTPAGPRLPPQVFMGIATSNGEVAPLGIGVWAYDDDGEVGGTTVGDGGTFTILVEESDGPIRFYVGGMLALERVPEWISGSVTPNFNLTARAFR